MRTLRIALASITIIALLAGHLLRNARPLNERAALSLIAPDRVFSEKAGSPPRYSSGSDLVAFNSFDIVKTVRGYAGPIQVMIVLGKDGTIHGIAIIDHHETRNYVHYMEGRQYLNSYSGKNVHDRFEIGKDIDGISRATVSVDAMARTVRESSRTVARDVFGVEVGDDEPAGAESYGWAWYALLFAAAMAGYFLSQRSRKYLRLRDATMITGILLIGVYLASPFSILHVFNLALLRPSFSLLWLVIVTSVIFSMAADGRFYCGWLCPYGAISEFIGRLPARKWNVPGELDNRWRRVKYILLGAAITAVFLTGRTEYGNYEAYVTLFSLHGHKMAWTLVALTLLANIRVRRFWCRYLCPVAAFSGIIARSTEGYPGSHDCPMENTKDPLMSECIRCNRCYQRTTQQEDKTLHNRQTKSDNMSI